MADPHVMTYARTYPIEPARAFDLVLPVSLAEVFSHRYGPIPPIARTEGDDAGWGTLDQERTVVLAGPGGGTMRERLTELEPGSHFGYRLSEITGGLRPLVRRADGEWRFTPAGTGTRVTWTWWVHPTNAATARTMPVLARLWRGFARLGFDELERVLVPA